MSFLIISRWDPVTFKIKGINFAVTEVEAQTKLAKTLEYDSGTDGPDYPNAFYVLNPAPEIDTSWFTVDPVNKTLIVDWDGYNANKLATRVPDIKREVVRRVGIQFSNVELFVNISRTLALIEDRLNNGSLTAGDREKMEQTQIARTWICDVQTAADKLIADKQPDGMLVTDRSLWPSYL